jgi:hypothetical protein
MEWTREELNKQVLYLLDGDIVEINKFLTKHSHKEPDVMIATEFSLEFQVTGIGTLIGIKCWCGEKETILTDERMNLL